MHCTERKKRDGLFFRDKVRVTGEGKFQQQRHNLARIECHGQRPLLKTILFCFFFLLCCCHPNSLAGPILERHARHHQRVSKDADDYLGTISAISACVHDCNGSFSPVFPLSSEERASLLLQLPVVSSLSSPRASPLLSFQPLRFASAWTWGGYNSNCLRVGRDDAYAYCESAAVGGRLASTLRTKATQASAVSTLCDSNAKITWYWLGATWKAATAKYHWDSDGVAVTVNWGASEPDWKAASGGVGFRVGTQVLEDAPMSFTGNGDTTRAVALCEIKVCEASDCDADGTATYKTGQPYADGCCTCKPRFAGATCASCASGYFGTLCQSEYCSRIGNDCDAQGYVQYFASNARPNCCTCKSNVVGALCTACATGMITFPSCNQELCTKQGNTCHAEGYTTFKNGAADVRPNCCVCKSNFKGALCDQCATGYDGLPTCSKEFCSLQGNTCFAAGTLRYESSLYRVPAPSQCCVCNPTFTGDNCDTCIAHYGPPQVCNKAYCSLAGNTCHPEGIAQYFPARYRDGSDGGCCQCAASGRFTGALCNQCANGYTAMPNCADEFCFLQGNTCWMNGTVRYNANNVREGGGGGGAGAVGCCTCERQYTGLKCDVRICHADFDCRGSAIDTTTDNSLRVHGTYPNCMCVCKKDFGGRNCRTLTQTPSLTLSMTRTVSVSTSHSISQSATQTQTRTGVISVTASLPETQSLSSSASLSGTFSLTSTFSATQSFSASLTVSTTSSPSVSASPSATVSLSRSFSLTLTLSASASSSASETASVTISQTLSASASLSKGTPSYSPSASKTAPTRSLSVSGPTSTLSHSGPTPSMSSTLTTTDSFRSLSFSQSFTCPLEMFMDNRTLRRTSRWNRDPQHAIATVQTMRPVRHLTVSGDALTLPLSSPPQAEEGEGHERGDGEMVNSTTTTTTPAEGNGTAPIIGPSSLSSSSSSPRQTRLDDPNAYLTVTLRDSLFWKGGYLLNLTGYLELTRGPSIDWQPKGMRSKEGYRVIVDYDGDKGVVIAHIPKIRDFLVDETEEAILFVNALELFGCGDGGLWLSLATLIIEPQRESLEVIGLATNIVGQIASLLSGVNDLQSIAMIGFMPCAGGLTSTLTSGKAALSLFAIEDSWLGVLSGNGLVVLGMVGLSFIALLLCAWRFRRVRRRRELVELSLERAKLEVALLANDDADDPLFSDDARQENHVDLDADDPLNLFAPPANDTPLTATATTAAASPHQSKCLTTPSASPSNNPFGDRTGLLRAFSLLQLPSTFVKVLIYLYAGTLTAGVGAFIDGMSALRQQSIFDPMTDPASEASSVPLFGDGPTELVIGVLFLIVIVVGFPFLMIRYSYAHVSRGLLLYDYARSITEPPWVSREAQQQSRLAAEEEEAARMKKKHNKLTALSSSSGDGIDSHRTISSRSDASSDRSAATTAAAFGNNNNSNPPTSASFLTTVSPSTCSPKPSSPLSSPSSSLVNALVGLFLPIGAFAPASDTARMFGHMVTGLRHMPPPPQSPCLDVDDVNDDSHEEEESGGDYHLYSPPSTLPLSQVRRGRRAAADADAVELDELEDPLLFPPTAASATGANTSAQTRNNGGKVTAKQSKHKSRNRKDIDVRSRGKRRGVGSKTNSIDWFRMRLGAGIATASSSNRSNANAPTAGADDDPLGLFLLAPEILVPDNGDESCAHTNNNSYGGVRMKTRLLFSSLMASPSSAAANTLPFFHSLFWLSLPLWSSWITAMGHLVLIRNIRICRITMAAQALLHFIAALSILIVKPHLILFTSLGAAVGCAITGIVFLFSMLLIGNASSPIVRDGLVAAIVAQQIVSAIRTVHTIGLLLWRGVVVKGIVRRRKRLEEKAMHEARSKAQHEEMLRVLMMQRRSEEEGEGDGDADGGEQTDDHHGDHGNDDDDDDDILGLGVLPSNRRVTTASPPSPSPQTATTATENINFTNRAADANGGGGLIGDDDDADGENDGALPFAWYHDVDAFTRNPFENEEDEEEDGNARGDNDVDQMGASGMEDLDLLILAENTNTNTEAPSLRTQQSSFSSDINKKDDCYFDHLPPFCDAALWLSALPFDDRRPWREAAGACLRHLAMRLVVNRIMSFLTPLLRWMRGGPSDDDGKTPPQPREEEEEGDEEEEPQAQPPPSLSEEPTADSAAFLPPPAPHPIATEDAGGGDEGDIDEWPRRRVRMDESDVSGEGRLAKHQGYIYRRAEELERKQREQANDEDALRREEDGWSYRLGYY